MIGADGALVPALVGAVTFAHLAGVVERGAHRKAIIDIADPLFEVAKNAAQQCGTMLRALVEMALCRVLEALAKNKRAFKL